MINYCKFDFLTNSNKYIIQYYDAKSGEHMVVSYILINTKPAMEHQVYDELKLNENVIEVHPLFGDYDLLVKIDVDNFDDLGKIILENIRQINGVEDTKTLTGIKI